jgi:sigma-B regulation protein RsbU (phosphoserine phosphatase)
MATPEVDYLRTQLLERRQRLESAVAHAPENASLAGLLQQVDAALERMGKGTYGVCEACHESIEHERLLADPLVCYCLDHLTPDERRRLEADLEQAARIQAALLPPRNLSVAGWEVHYHYEPAGPVSGDYCDLIPADGQKGDLFFLVGDVSGKGVAASLLMSHLHAIFRALVSASLPVEALVEQANRILCASALSGQYATLVCGRARAGGAVEICNAGHPPVLVARGGEVAQMDSTGMPVGLFCSTQYGARRLELAPGDALFLYTDGLSEARNAASAEYGAARLARVVAESHSRGAQGLTEACLDDLRRFAAGARRADDLTILALRRAA